MHDTPTRGIVGQGGELRDAGLAGDVFPAAPAQRLAPLAYRSLAFAAREDEAIWTREWICVGAEDELGALGDLLPFTVGTHGIHLQRGPDGAIAGRFNKAQHGGCRVVPVQCQGGTKTRCSFTSCGYSRDRGVIAADELGDDAPAMHQYLGLRPDRLLPVRVAARDGLLFAHLDPHEPAGALPDPRSVALDFLRRPGVRRIDAAWQEHRSNWKIAGQALVAGHVIAADEDRGWIATRVRLAGGEAAHALWLFPNLVLLTVEDHGCAVILQPTALGEALHRLTIFAAQGARGDADARLAFWRTALGVRAQAGEAMQRDLAERGYAAPPSPAADPLGNWMHGVVAKRMASRCADAAADFFARHEAPTQSSPRIRIL
jgi:hypothetical protein